MAKPLDPKAIEAERQTSSRAERREQKRRQMQDESYYHPAAETAGTCRGAAQTPCCGVLPRQHTGGKAGRQL